MRRSIMKGKAFSFTICALFLLLAVSGLASCGGNGPPLMLFGSCLTAARYTAKTAMVSMETTKTLPARTWRREPFLKIIAAVPDSNPNVPAKI